MASNLANARGGILPHVLVDVLQAEQDAREDLGLHDHFGQVHAVLGDLRQAAADLGR